MSPLSTRDLLHFEEVEEVIKLRKGEKAREYVEKYVLSKSLRDHLLRMIEALSGPTHKSFNVVGNYGTGKSHFLAFVAALLEHPEYRPLVQDEMLRAALDKFDRRYLVVKFELGAVQEVSLRYIFFDQACQQLAERYAIETRPIDLQADYDNKKNVLNLLADLKASDPEAGLVVIVDEISDFIKQKDKTGMAHDIALLRELGEISQDSDFLYIGAMQEHVFTNPKYIEQAESIARVNQRFVTVTITKEDVSQVLGSRVLRKDADQRLQLQNLLGNHKAYFPNLALDLDKYITLYPMHPYVIEVFERLPYFENRGVIGFTVQNVQRILDLPAPAFVTYDRIFDLIQATHEIRNQPQVAQVLNVAQTLLGKADLVNSRYREDALRLIKALAVLKLLGGDKDLGATSQELANTLLITPPGKLLVDANLARDHIERVMKDIREVTVGQYIDAVEGRYWLNLAKIEDYDARIDQRAQAAVAGHNDEIERQFREFVIGELGLANTAPLLPGRPVYLDSAPWPSRKAFRPGLLIIGRAEEAITHGDYRLALQGPLPGKSAPRQDELTVMVDFNDEMIRLLVRARAASMLSNEKIHTKLMADLAKKALADFRSLYLARLWEQGIVLFGGHKTELKKLPARHSLNSLRDILEHVQGEMLDDFFKERYPNFPVFRTLLTAANLESEALHALQALDKQPGGQLDFNSRGYLEAFGAFKDGQFSANASPACQLILQRVKANDQAHKLTALSDLEREFGQSPWGLPAALLQLLLGALLLHGRLVFVRQGGKRLNAGDLSPLLKTSLDFFKDILYVEGDQDLDVEALDQLFLRLGLKTDALHDKDTRPQAVKDLHVKGLELKNQLAALRQSFNAISSQAQALPDLPWLGVQGVLSRLAALDEPVNAFASVNKVSDLGKLPAGAAVLDALPARLADLQTLESFAADWLEGNDLALGKALPRLLNCLKVLPALLALATPAERAILADLQRIAEESRQIYTDQAQLLKPELRRPLKGKLEQFRQKYQGVYYGLHRRLAGDEAPWEALKALLQGSRAQALAQLKSLPFISPIEFNKATLELQGMERRRCRDFNAQTLEGFDTCPYCRFPEEGAGLAQIPERLASFQQKLDKTWQAWNEQIFEEMPAAVERLPLLSGPHRAAIEALLLAGSLPESIEAELSAALYELFSELQAVELDLNDLARALTADQAALTESELRQRFDQYLRQLIRGCDDPTLLRIKIKV